MKKMSYKTGGMSNKNKSATVTRKATGRSGGTNAPARVSPSARRGGSTKSKKR